MGMNVKGSGGMVEEVDMGGGMYKDAGEGFSCGVSAMR